MSATYKCQQCQKEMGNEWILGPVCGKCCRANHARVTGQQIRTAVKATVRGMEAKLAMLRYARKDRRVYEHSLCQVCGAAGGCDRDGCRTATCLWCGTPQCSSNGLGRGTCAVCFHGFLPNWSGCHEGQACSYKGCQEAAVGIFPRKGRVCATHAERILGPDYLKARLAERDHQWTVVEVRA